MVLKQVALFRFSDWLLAFESLLVVTTLSGKKTTTTKPLLEIGDKLHDQVEKMYQSVPVQVYLQVIPTLRGSIG